MASAWTNKTFAAALLALIASALASAAATVASDGAPHFSRLDSLFIIAATGEPRFKAQRDSCEKVLIRMDTAALDYLLAQRLSGQTPRQRHYVEHLFSAIADSGRNPHAAQRLAAALPGRADSLRIQLLHIGSELGDSGFLATARLYLRADSVEVRKAAIRSLGSYPNPKDAALLLGGIEKTMGLERQERLWALSKQKRIPEWAALLPLLGDPDLCNRQLIRQIAIKSAASDWAELSRHMPVTLEPGLRLEWMLLGLECGTPQALAYVRANLAALEPSRRRFLAAMLPPSLLPP